MVRARFRVSGKPTNATEPLSAAQPLCPSRQVPESSSSPVAPREATPTFGYREKPDDNLYRHNAHETSEQQDSRLIPLRSFPTDRVHLNLNKFRSA